VSRARPHLSAHSSARLCPQGFVVLTFASPDPLYNALAPVYIKLSTSTSTGAGNDRVVLVTAPLLSAAAGGNVTISVNTTLAVPGLTAAVASSGITYQWQFTQSFTLVGGSMWRSMVPIWFTRATWAI
jgi:hypothetical protein